MNGALYLDGAINSSSQAATKAYVDSSSASVLSSSYASLSATTNIIAGAYVSKAGDTMSGMLAVNGATLVTGLLNASGGVTITGELNCVVGDGQSFSVKSDWGAALFSFKSAASEVEYVMHGDGWNDGRFVITGIGMPHVVVAKNNAVGINGAEADWDASETRIGGDDCYVNCLHVDGISYFNGPLVIQNMPTDSNHAVPKSYADGVTNAVVARAKWANMAAVASNALNASGCLSGLAASNTFLYRSGDTVAGRLNINGPAVVTGCVVAANGLVVTGELRCVVGSGQSFKVKNESGAAAFSFKNEGQGVEYVMHADGWGQGVFCVTGLNMPHALVAKNGAVGINGAAADWDASETRIGGDDCYVNELHIAGAAYVDYGTGEKQLADIESCVMRSGGVMSGTLTLAGPPTTANDAATKAYVDGATNAVLSTGINGCADVIVVAKSGGHTDSIAQGVELCPTGGVLLIAPGVYALPTEVVLRKSIAIRGMGNTRDVILTAQGNHGIFRNDSIRFRNLANRFATFENLCFASITNYFYAMRSALFLDYDNAYPIKFTIRNCIFENCVFSVRDHNTAQGGAVSIRGGIVENCRFIACSIQQCDYANGGALYSYGGTEIRNCSFIACSIRNNSSNGDPYPGGYNNGGGAVYIQDGVVINCSFQDCFVSPDPPVPNYTATAYGGAVCAVRSDISHCDFAGCYAYFYLAQGGTLYLDAGSSARLCSIKTSNGTTALAGSGSAVGMIVNGKLLMNNQTIENLGQPVNAGDAATKGYSDAISNAAAAAYVRKSGDTMTGPLSILANTTEIGLLVQGSQGAMHFFPQWTDGYAYFEAGYGAAARMRITALGAGPLNELELKANETKLTGNTTVAGALTMSSAGNWQVGSPSTRADVVLKNGTAAIRNDAGPLTLAAAANHTINLQSFAQLSAAQFGRATIMAGGDAVLVTGKSVGSAAVIIVTPNGGVPGTPYVQIAAPDFWIKIPQPAAQDTIINYLILSR
jgi:hypothetical protein